MYPWGHKFLTKNSDVEVLQFFSYLCVDLKTIRKVNWNDANFTTVLLLYGGGNTYVGGVECHAKLLTNQLTDLISHFLQFVLRATHDDHIQSLPGQLKMKQFSN